MNKKISLFFVGILVISLFMACSNDDEYKSKVPNFSGIEFNRDTLYTEQTVVATAVQREKAKLIDRTEYNWYSADLPSDSTMRWTNAVLYPSNPTNPTCTFQTPSRAGTYTLTFHGSYNISGQAGNSTSSVEIQDGTITYEYTPLKAYVTINKTFKVVARNR